MNKSIVIALVIALVAVGWIVSGQFAAQTPPEPITSLEAESETEAKDDTPVVRIIAMTAAPHARDLILRGRTMGVRTVVVKAETTGRVESIAAEKGDSVTAETPLVTLALEDRPARLARAQAEVQQRQIEYDAARKLSKKGLQSRTRLAEATAALQGTRANLALARLELKRAKIAAPFSGIMDDRDVEVGDYVQPGDPIATVIDLDPILIVADLSERDIGKVRVGANAKGRLVSGEKFSGMIRFIASRGSLETRTFRIEMEVANANGHIPENATAEIHISGNSVMTHRVSPMVLTLSDDGLVGVKILDAEDRVVFAPVEIVSETTQGLYISGLPLSVRMITVGQEFVIPGQRVNPTLDERISPALTSPAKASGGPA